MQEKLTTEYLMIAKRKMESQKVPGPYFVFCDEETAKELKEMGFKEYTWDVLPEPFNNYFVLYEITGIKLHHKEEIQMITEETLDNWFEYHPPEDDYDVAAYKGIRKAGKELAYAIFAKTPPGADQTAAIRKVREAVMTANAAIACKHGPNG